MSEFSKKHYDKIAKLFSDIPYYMGSKEYFTNLFVDFFKLDNSRFNAEKFISACKSKDERKEVKR